MHAPARAVATGEVAYEIAVDARARELAVTATLPPGARVLGLTEGAQRFVRDAVDGAGAPLARRDDRWVVGCDRGCTIKYRFLLREAGDDFDDPDVATTEGEIVEAPPATWLLRPLDLEGSTTCRLHVTAPPPVRFATGIPPSKSTPGTYEIALDDVDSSPYSAFGPTRSRTVDVPGARIELAVAPGRMRADDDALARWVEMEAKAIAGYYGRFPVSHALVLVLPGRSAWIGPGKTLAGGGASIMVRVGEHATMRTLDNDWVLAHEMTHLAFPSVARNQLWIEEGLATYVEPIARLRAGLADAREVWKGFVEGLPNGLPARGDRGLDRTPTWGRTYWGGALFCLVADVRIRKATRNAKSLDDALRAILAAGGDNAHRWPLARAFEIGDRATGTNVLRELYAQWSEAPVSVDLDALLRDLGVVRSADGVTFDDGAPSAAVRRAITQGSRAQGEPSASEPR